MNSEPLRFFMGPSHMCHVARSMKIAAHTCPSISGRNGRDKSRLAQTPGARGGVSPRKAASLRTAVRWVDARADAADTN